MPLLVSAKYSRVPTWPPCHRILRLLTQLAQPLLELRVPTLLSHTGFRGDSAGTHHQVQDQLQVLHGQVENQFDTPGTSQKCEMITHLISIRLHAVRFMSSVAQLVAQVWCKTHLAKKSHKVLPCLRICRFSQWLPLICSVFIWCNFWPNSMMTSC